MSAREFYEMSIVELSDAIDGFNELRKEEFQEYLIGCRLVSFYNVIPHTNKVKSPKDLFELDSDKSALKRRISKMKPIEVIRTNAK
jgi:hypothetical protein